MRDLEFQILMNIFVSRAANPYYYTQKSLKWGNSSSKSLWIYLCREQQTLIITRGNHSNEGFGVPNLYEYTCVESSKPLQLHAEIIYMKDFKSKSLWIYLCREQQTLINTRRYHSDEGFWIQILMNIFESRAANPYNYTQKSFKWGILSFKSLTIYLCQEQQTLIITRGNHSNEGVGVPNPYEYIWVESSKPLQLHA
jgi:hypothetical protein